MAPLNIDYSETVIYKIAAAAEPVPDPAEEVGTA